MKISRTAMALVGLAIPAFCQIPDFTPPTPLIGAIVRSDWQAARKLLEGGADPNEGRFLGAPPLILALMQQDLATVKTLLAKGADAKIADGAGSTSLMWAATAETSGESVVAELLKQGVDPNAKNKNGDSAMVWAMRRGFTPTVQLLKQHGASDRELVRASIEKSIALLMKSGPEFVKVSGCTSCHHQSLPQMAYGFARQHGIPVDKEASERQAKSVLAMFKPSRADMLQGKPSIPDPSVSVSYSLLGLAAEGYAPDETTQAMAHLIATQQMPDGRFTILGARPPMESSAVSATALSIRALQLYGDKPDAVVRKGVEWLLTAKASTNEERAMRVLGLAWGKGPREAIAEAAKALVAEQRADGGWGQLAGLESDAYATGQAMVALQLAGISPSFGDSYEKGVAFLLRTQLADGSWHVRTRSFPFQKLKESGFPHGRDQWISASGSAWATMALTLALPEDSTQLSKAF